MYRKNSIHHLQGFSLIELIIVIGIISILLSAAWFGFSAYSRKSKMESQIRTLYADLMTTRAKAMFEKRVMTFQFTTNGYTILADGVTTDTRSLFYPITWNNATNVIYGTNGLLNDAADGKSICLSQSNEASVDAVVLSVTRVQIGKKNEGTNCEAVNIVAK